MIKVLTRSNTAFFVPIQIAVSIFIFYYLYSGTYSKYWFLVAFGCYFLTGCLGITLTFHRYLSHKSFSMPKFFEYLFTIFGAIGGTGSSIGWVAIHRLHHTHSDQLLDPHSPRISGWKVLFPYYKFEMNKWAIRDMIANPFHLFLHEYYFAILFFWSLMVYLCFGIQGLVFIVFGPMFLQIWISVISNYGNHQPTWGYQNFKTNEDSINSWWLAALTWGEGWHNNHHRYPGRASFKSNWWEFDITGSLIALLRTDIVTRKKPISEAHVVT